MDGGNFNVEHAKHGYEVCEVKSIEAVSMSALRFRMSHADKAMVAGKVFCFRRVFFILVRDGVG